eukprot:g858.t1
MADEGGAVEGNDALGTEATIFGIVMVTVVVTTCACCLVLIIRNRQAAQRRIKSDEELKMYLEGKGRQEKMEKIFSQSTERKGGLARTRSEVDARALERRPSQQLGASGYKRRKSIDKKSRKSSSKRRRSKSGRGGVRRSRSASRSGNLDLEAGLATGDNRNIEEKDEGGRGRSDSKKGSRRKSKRKSKLRHKNDPLPGRQKSSRSIPTEENDLQKMSQSRPGMHAMSSMAGGSSQTATPAIKTTEPALTNAAAIEKRLKSQQSEIDMLKKLLAEQQKRGDVSQQKAAVVSAAGEAQPDQPKEIREKHDQRETQEKEEAEPDAKESKD